MKPLFDSELFSFIGSSDDCILVHCRKCGHQATVELSTRTDGATLRATCPECNNSRTFIFSNVIKSAAMTA
jgi:ribosomal protein S27E